MLSIDAGGRPYGSVEAFLFCLLSHCWVFYEHTFLYFASMLAAKSALILLSLSTAFTTPQGAK